MKNTINLTEELQNLGLSQTSAKVYLSLLHTGKQTISELSKTSGLYRPSIYTAISPLIEKGLITKLRVGKRWVFLALPPETLQNLAEETVAKQQLLFSALKEKYEKLGSRPIVSYFEGKEGIERAYEILLAGAQKDDIIYRYESPKDYKQNAKYYPTLYWQLATRHGPDNSSTLQKFVITNESTLKQRSPRLERHDKALPTRLDSFDYDITQLIFKDKVMFVDYENKVVTLIQNQKFADFQKQIYKFIFQKLT